MRDSKLGPLSVVEEETNSQRNSEISIAKEKASSPELPEAEGSEGGNASDYEDWMAKHAAATAKFDESLEDSAASSSCSDDLVDEDDKNSPDVTQGRPSLQDPLEADSSSKTRNTHTHT